MQLIGKGWQYRVYDLGNGRVRKVPRRGLDSYWRALTSQYSPTRSQPFKSFEEVRRIEQVGQESIGKLKEYMPPALQTLLGNPVFVEDILYEQDKVASLGEYFESHTEEENKKAITAYAELLVELWKYGIGDAVFNFTLNNGITKEGNVIQIDIGEFVFSKESIAEKIQNKQWLNQSSYLWLKSERLKEFYRSEMDRVVTLEELNKNWNIYMEESKYTAETRPSAGGIILNSEGKILLVNQHNNSWSFPKGGLEIGESELEAAKREIREEAGITELEYVGELGSYERYSLGKDGKSEDIAYGLRKRTLFLFRTNQTPKPDHVETTDVRWVSIDEALALLTHPKDKEFLASVRERIENAVK